MVGPHGKQADGAPEAPGGDAVGTVPDGEAIAQRHQRLAMAARAYLDGPGSELPGLRRLGPARADAAIVLCGAHALGQSDRRLHWELELVLTDENWKDLGVSARPSELSWRDPRPSPAVELRVRDAAWLRARLAEPPVLWLHQRATSVQDPGGRMAALLQASVAALRGRIHAEVSSRYRTLRGGLADASSAADPLGARLAVATAARAALELAVLARGEPYPPAPWLAGYVAQVVPEGEQLVALCGRLVGAGAAVPTAVAELRRTLDERLDAAGYGPDLIQAYPRLH